MRPNRRLPPWWRLLLEYAGMTGTFFLVLWITGMALTALLASILVMLVGRLTRPKMDAPDVERPTSFDGMRTAVSPAQGCT